MNKKILSLLCAALIMSSICFTGCSTPKDELGKALENQTTLTALECSSEITVKQLGGTTNKVDTTSINLNFKQKKLSQEHLLVNMNMSMNVENQNFAFDIFYDQLYKDNKTELKAVIGMPEQLSSSFSQLTGKPIKYLILDTSRLDKSVLEKNPQLDFSKLSESSKEITSLLQQAMNQYLKKLDSNSNKLIVDLGKKDLTINSKSVTAHNYQLKFTDEQFKDYIKILQENLNKDAKLKDSLLSNNAVLGSIMDSSDALSKNDKILGKDGATITISIKDNFIVQETYDFNYIVNDPNNSGAKPNELNMHIDSKYFNINNKDLNITAPATDSNNSLDLAELLNNQ